MDAVSRAYDQWSLSYDHDRNPTRDLDATVLRTADLPLAGKDVLEIGCGTGKNTVWLASQAHALTAMDFSAGMLAHARERVVGDHVRFVQHDVREVWPLPSASVDAVVGNLVLEHIEHVRLVFDQAARVLRPGGTMYFCELHPFRQWRGGQAHFTDVRGDVVQVPAFTHSVSDYINSAMDAGFELVRVGEWIEADAAPGVAPRLLSVTFRRQRATR